MDDETMDEALKYQHDLGFDEGYEQGYEDGYIEGYNKAKEES